MKIEAIRIEGKYTQDGKDCWTVGINTPQLIRRLSTRDYRTEKGAQKVAAKLDARFQAGETMREYITSEFWRTVSRDISLQSLSEEGYGQEEKAEEIVQSK